MDAIQLYYKVRGKWPVIAWSVLACLVVAFIYILVAPRIYSSSAALQVQQAGEKLLGASDNAEDVISPEVLQTIEQNLTSQTLQLRVIKAAHLATDPDFAPPKRDGKPYLDSELLELWKWKLSVELRRGTRLIDVSVEDKNPEHAQFLVKTFLAQYSELTFGQQLNSMKAAVDYLSEEVQKYWGDLPRIRDALAKKDPDSLLDVASISADPDVAGLQTRIHVEEANFASVKEVFMENHPRYIAAEQRLQELHEAQRAAIMRAAGHVQNLYDNAESTVAELKTRLQQQEQAVLQGSVTSDVLTGELDSDRALCDAVLARLNQPAVAQSTNENQVKVVEEPLVPAKPIRPRSALLLVAALLVGIVIGLGLIIGRDHFNSAFTGVDDIEAVLGAHVLTTVPKSPSFSRGRDAVTEKPNSVEAESFRTLRTSIQLIESRGENGTDKIPKSVARNAVLFTSSHPGEGKTSCAYNYAIMLSRQGLRTLLIDGDLRRATLSRLMRVTKGPGLAEVLAAKTRLSDAIQPTSLENLVLLAAGEGASTSEHIDPGHVRAVIGEASAQFDRVVIDSPPINAVSDSLLIAPHVLMNCLVIHAGVTPKAAVMRASLLLKQVNRGHIGIILNQVGTDSRSAYECYGYNKDFVYSYGEK